MQTVPIDYTQSLAVHFPVVVGLVWGHATAVNVNGNILYAAFASNMIINMFARD